MEKFQSEKLCRQSRPCQSDNLVSDTWFRHFYFPASLRNNAFREMGLCIICVLRICYTYYNWFW